MINSSVTETLRALQTRAGIVKYLVQFMCYINLIEMITHLTLLYYN